MATNPGAPKARRGRPILSLQDKRPQECPSFAGVEHSDVTENLDPVQRFEAYLWNERNKFDINKRRSGLFGSRKIGKAEAAKLLRQSLADLEREVAI